MVFQRLMASLRPLCQGEPIGALVPSLMTTGSAAAVFEPPTSARAEASSKAMVLFLKVLMRLMVFLVPAWAGMLSLNYSKSCVPRDPIDDSDDAERHFISSSSWPAPQHVIEWLNQQTGR